MNPIRLLFFILLAVLALGVIACRGSQEPEPTATPEPEPTATPEPEPTPDATADFVSFTDDFSGLTLSHPEGWTAFNFFFTILASDESLIEAMFENMGDEDLPPLDDGALMIVISNDLSEFDSDDPEEILAEATEEFELGGDEEVEIIEGPTRFQVNGQEAIMIVAQAEQDGTKLTTVFGLIINKELERAVVLVGITGTAVADQYVPTLKAIISTVELSEPDMDSFGGLFDGMFDNMLDDFFTFGDAIFIGDTVEGEVTEEGPAKYTFYGQGGEAVDIVVTPLDSGLDVVVDVLDEDGQSILPGGEVDDALSVEQIKGLIFDEDGFYTISVRGFALSTGAFELSLSVAGAMESNLRGPGSELVASTALVQSDEHLYRFVAEEGGAITAVVEPEDFDAVLEIRDDETGETLLEVDASFGREELTFTATEFGRYALVVRGYAGQKGAYDISVIMSPDVLFELEVGDMVYGWLDESGRTEYVFEAEAGDTLQMYVEPEAGFDVVIELFDLNDKLIWAVDDAASGQAEELVYTFTEDGVYFILIRGFAGGAGGKFTLTIDE